MSERMKHTATRAAAASLVVALAACSGHAGSGVVPNAPKHPASSSISFTMHWPSAQTLAQFRSPSAVRRPKFISPSTQSVVVEVNNDSTLMTMANKPAQGNISTVSVNAPVGNDSITITTWDQQNGTGNLLGQITVAQTVVAGQLNTVSATVDGVMEKIGVSGAPSGFLETAKDSTGNPQFTLVGAVPQTFTVVPEDVDGNVIVPPGNAPTLTMTSNDSSISVTPVNGKADQYTVQAVGLLHGSSAALKVNGIDGVGNNVTAQFALNQSAAIYVGYAGPSGTSIVAYDQQGNVVPTTGSFAGIADASAMTLDTKRNRLVVADAALGTLCAFDFQGNVDSSFAQSPITGANGVVYDPDLDRLYVTQSSQHSVSAFTGDGAPVTLAGTPFAGMSLPSSITYNPDLYGYTAGPQLLVADTDTGATVQVPAFNPDGTPTSGGLQYQSSTDSFYSLAVAYDSWVDKVFVVGNSNVGNGPFPMLREFDPAYGNSAMITATQGLNDPRGIAFNPVNREIYITNGGDASVSVFQDMTASSTFNQDTSAKFVPPNGQTIPKGIAIVY